MFDGHAGAECAKYAAAQLIGHLEASFVADHLSAGPEHLSRAFAGLEAGMLEKCRRDVRYMMFRVCWWCFYKCCNECVTVF